MATTQTQSTIPTSWRERLPIIGALACLWAILHSSPYYPLTLSSSFSIEGIDAVSINHLLYSTSLIIVFVALVLGWQRISPFLSNSHATAAAGGVSGTVGSLLLVFLPSGSNGNEAVVGVALMLTAVWVAMSVMALGCRAASMPASDMALCVALSYCAYCVVWLAGLAIGEYQSWMLAACPTIGSICIGWTKAPLAMQKPRIKASKGLPVGIIALSLIFIYFGVIGVRALTAMQQGANAIGAPISHQVITTVISLLICSLFAFQSQRGAHFGNSRMMSSLTFLILVYMASLMLVTVGDGFEALAVTGKRALVATEHCLEAFLFSVLAAAVGKNRLDTPTTFGLFGVLVIAMPQLISFDFMYQAGVLERLSSLNIITPMAAVASFAVATISIRLLASYAAKAERMAATRQNDWPEELCRNALSDIGATQRELDVIVLTYRGHSAKKIAQSLLVSESTVKTHISHVYRKLGIHSKQELIAYIDGFREESN